MLHWIVYFILISIVFVKLGIIYVLGFTLNQIIIIIGLFFGLASNLFSKKVLYRFNATDICLVIFGGYLWFSNFVISDNSDWGIRICIDYFRSLACYFIVILLINDVKKIRLLVVTYVLASTAMALTTNPFETVDSGLKFITEARQGLTGFADSYIIYAIYALMSIPLAFGMYKNVKNSSRFAFLIITIVLSIATLFSGSRGAAISFAVTVILIIAIEAQGKRKLYAWDTLMVMVIALGLAIVFWLKGGKSILGTLVAGEGQKLDASLAGRMAFQREAFSQFLSHPVFGIGTDAFRYSSSFKHVPHSQWLQILSELGLIGFTIAAYTTYTIFKNLISAKKVLKRIGDNNMIYLVNGVMVSIFALLFWGLYENIGYISAQKTLFMLIGLAVSINSFVVRDLCVAHRESIYKTYPIPDSAGVK